jgi:hypothetical protein
MERANGNGVVLRGVEVVSSNLQNLALSLVLLACKEGGTGSVLEHLADTLVGLGRALQVLLRTDLLADVLGL